MSLFMAVILALGFATAVRPAYAQDNSTGSIEIGKKVKIKKDADWGRVVLHGDNGRIRARLFHTELGLRAYCIEYDVKVYEENDATVTARWEDFPGNNNFKNNPEAAQKINWIAANSFPAISKEELLANAGITGTMDDATVIAVTQGAIWNIASDSFKYQSLEGSSPAQHEQEQKLFEYLTDNPGRVESSGMDEAKIKPVIDSSKAIRKDNGVFGPFVVTTGAHELQVSVEPKGIIVDAEGNPIEASSIKKDQEFYFKVDEKDGSATLSARASDNIIDGALIITIIATVHGQTLITTHDKKRAASAEQAISWEGTNLKLGTTATDKHDSDKKLSHKGGTVVDVVAYEGLIVGKQYTIKGELMERLPDGTGKATGITKEVTFTPETPNGEVKVEFTVPEGFDGKTLVVFERAYDANGKLIAEHTDINDANQTVQVAESFLGGSMDYETGVATTAIVAGGLVLTAVGLVVATRTKTREVPPLGESPAAPAAPVKGMPKSETPAPPAKGVAKTEAANSPAAKPALANTGVSGIIPLLLITLAGVTIGGVLISRNRRRN
ncbi:MAG: VaFE repeat-containing surface-anchored protein [Corynebacterium sp.]|uniref:VaFE repeat-containing surface-anchored protein n=1 Tax=Corynebacterium sp. TaxID=1720 RepID=UPI0026DC8C70|nr:VaFE repeat-containing surface-anchored protein [Corynebacterium sp.]MDO5099786.1 VaFE repeat-containing surface-anchored protein [Corynebacterium sp.]